MQDWLASSLLFVLSRRDNQLVKKTKRAPFLHYILYFFLTVASVFTFFERFAVSLANFEVPWIMVGHRVKPTHWLLSPWLMAGIFIVEHSKWEELHVL